MARKTVNDAVKRCEAMRLRVEAKRVRTIEDLFTMRRAVMEDIQLVTVQREFQLNRVYGGEKGPPDTGKWNPHPKHRRLFFHVPSRPDQIKCIDFGWSFAEPYRDDRKRGWVMCWSEDYYEGYADRRLIRDVVGRDPKNQLDELVCAGLVAEALEANDEELGLAFWNVQHRLNQLWRRNGVVNWNIEHSIQKVLEKQHDWRPGREEPWRRVEFEDGTIVTVTSQGDVVFDDVVLTTRISLQSPSEKRYTLWGNLADRQRRALERK